MSSTSAPRVPSPTRKRILIVDDDASVCESLAAVLETENYEVLTASNGLKAVEVDSQSPPDLVIMDLNMPMADGWTAFKQIEAQHPFVRIVVITARPNQYARAISLKVDGFMEKPLDIPQLLQFIRNVLDEPQENHFKRVSDPRFVTARLRGPEKAELSHGSSGSPP